VDGDDNIESVRLHATKEPRVKQSSHSARTPKSASGRKQETFTDLELAKGEANNRIAFLSGNTPRCLADQASLLDRQESARSVNLGRRIKINTNPNLLLLIDQHFLAL